MKKNSAKHSALIRCALLGGSVVFLWSVLSWMIIPWHAMSLNKFSNESEVAEAIKKNAPRSGIYILPNTYGYDCCASPGDMEESRKLMDCGPVMFSSIQLCGVKKCSIMPFITALVTLIIGAGIISWMLMLTRLGFWSGVLFVTLFGFAVGLLGIVPAWIWWGFSLCYTVIMIFDLIVGWFLAGLVISRLAFK